MGQGGRYCLRNWLLSSLPQSDRSLATDPTPWQKSIPISFPVSFSLKLQPQQASVIAARKVKWKKAVFSIMEAQNPKILNSGSVSKDHLVRIPCILQSSEQDLGKFPFSLCLSLSSDGASAMD